MSEGQSPKTQVRGSIGDASKDELDGLDDGVDEDFAEVVVFLILGNVFHKSVLDFLEAIGLRAKQAGVLVIHVMGGNMGKLIRGVVVALAAAAELHARDGAEHEWKANEGNVDEDVGDLLLVIEELKIVIVGS